MNGAALSAVMADHDRGPEYALVECANCPASERVEHSLGVTDAELKVQFEQLGWSITPTLCPACAELKAIEIGSSVMSDNTPAEVPRLELMTNWYATRIHIVGTELGRGSMSRFRSLCEAAYGESLSDDAARRDQHGWAPKVYSTLPLCRFCVRAWAKDTGVEPDIVGLLPADPANLPAPRAAVGRPWRIERFANGKWRSLTTVSTRERADQELAWYRGVGYGQLRIHNRDTGEVIE